MTMGQPADRVLDCSGLPCPRPVIEAAKAIREIEIGQVLELVATDPAVEPDMTAWTRRTGHELLGVVRDGGACRVTVRRRR